MYFKGNLDKPIMRIILILKKTGKIKNLKQEEI